MSYSRFSGFDVYVFMDVYGSLQCCGCLLDDQWHYDSTQAMVDHLAEHRAAGHNVPDGIEAALWEDDEENFPPQCAAGHDWGEPFHPYPDSESVAFITRRKCKRCGWEM